MKNKRFCDLVVGDNIAIKFCDRYFEKEITNIIKGDNGISINTDWDCWFFSYDFKDISNGGFDESFKILCFGEAIATSMDKLLLECGDINV